MEAQIYSSDAGIYLKPAWFQVTQGLYGKILFKQQQKSLPWSAFTLYIAFRQISIA